MRFSGITFLGKHSYRDFGLTIASREITQPNKIKSKYRPPHSNKSYDFSSIYGFQTFEERELKYTFNLIEKRNFGSNVNLNILKMKIVNWLGSVSGQFELKDDVYPGFHFLAEVEDGATFEPNWVNGTLEVTFIAYPFMIDNNYEGHDLWNDFKFDFDVSQNTDISFTVNWDSFVQVPIGSFVHIGDWATDFGDGGEISPMLMGQTYQVTAMQTTDYSSSKREYQLFGITGWVLEQDIVEAQTDIFDKVLINPGTNAVTAEVLITGKNLTIQDTKGDYFNIVNQPTNSYSFKLYPGENYLKLYGQKGTYTVDFKFRKELL